MQNTDIAPAVEIAERAKAPKSKELLTPQIISILTELHQSLQNERKQLLSARKLRQAEYDIGNLPGYESKTGIAASGNWSVAPIPDDLKKRRVEITGPVNSTKMVINMLSRNKKGKRADMAMLDFEDSMKPDWTNVIDGIHNVIGAARKDLELYKPAKNGSPEKYYKLDPDDMAGVMVRVRGLHLDETAIMIDGEPVSAGLFDLVMCLFHAGPHFVNDNKTPKFYVPKVEHYAEARWWNRLFIEAQNACGMSEGTLRATFLIETLTAAFQIEEILYEIRDHAAGLNVGRWDKIFSDIKVLRYHKDRIMADRGSINMKKFWMENYAKRLIKICHSRGAFAIGGMSAFTPGKTPQLRKEQTRKVAEDKTWEAQIGHDGCWVSHPYFITVALEPFSRDNQLDVTLDEFDKYPDLLPVPEGPKTLAGLRTNIRVGIGYMEGWNRGIGCVAWDGLMEDLATLEISRAQVWHWLHHKVVLDDGTIIARELVEQLFAEELDKIIQEVKDRFERDSAGAEQVIAGFQKAAGDAQQIFLREELADFLSEVQLLN